jgi:hypothetical protein
LLRDPHPRPMEVKRPKARGRKRIKIED